MSSATLLAVPSNSSSTTSTLSATRAQLEESARYAVLRRMGSAIRHQIAGALQPISMIASMVERRAQKDVPDIVALRKNCSEMSTLSRTASTECVALIGWLAPPVDEIVSVANGVDDCLDLLGTEFSFRGFAIANAVGETTTLVSQTAIRTVLSAALMAAADAADETGQLTITSLVSDRTATLSIGLKTTAGEAVPARPKGYRLLSWQEVELLADAEQVGLKLTGQGAQLVFEAREPKPRPSEARWG